MGKSTTDARPYQYPRNHTCQNICLHMAEFPVGVGTDAAYRDHGKERGALCCVLSVARKKHPRPRCLYRFYVEFRDPLLDKAKLLGHRIGDIHIPAFDIGPPVIDNPFGGLAIIRVHKSDFGPQG